MRGRRQPTAAVSARRIVSLGLALGVTLLALLVTPVAGAAPSQSFASHIAAQTPTVTISNPIATPDAPTPTPGGPPTATPSPTPTRAATTATTATTPTSTPSAGSTPTPTPPTTTTASASASLAHVPAGTMSITYNPATRIARTVFKMTGMSQRGTAVAVVLNGTCSAPGGVAGGEVCR